MSPDGRVWLDGFGHHDGQNLGLRTAPLSYVSPNGEASQAGDVYALGAILGELLSGECPLQAEDVETLHYSRRMLLITVSS